MTDTIELDETEYDPSQPDYLTNPTRPYQEALTANQVKLLMAYQECENMIQEGVEDEESGALKQIDGAYKIYSRRLWRYAISDVTQQKYRRQEEWMQECITRHKGRLFSRTNFFIVMRDMGIGLGLGLNHDDALHYALNHTAVDEMIEAGMLEVKTVMDGKRKTVVPTFTPLGEQKLLKGGLKTPHEHAKDIAGMTTQDAIKTVRHDIGRRYTYCSYANQYSGGTPLFDESKAKVFALEFTFVDPDNGSTPYQGKLLLEGDIPDSVLLEVMKKLKGDFTL